ncbi:MAG: selenide, water dikinase SelD [Elusimicrobiota bacterium]
MDNYKLTHGVSCAGCAAKVSQKTLEKILHGRKFYRSASTVIGIENFDDAGVYRLKDGSLLVQSTDFFPPIVDEPYDFGRIATANALSDIYVMGAEPITALNLCCFPSDKYPEQVYSEILDGSAEVLETAECTLLGGHTIKDTELKFGIAATGIADDDSLITNSAARENDVLFLTKPLGTGIITTAIKKNICPDSSREQAIKSMTALNKSARDLMTEHGIKAATDITGFGLIGHALEMCRASGINMRIYMETLPVFDGVFELLELGAFPGGSKKNKEEHFSYVDMNPDVSADIIFDAQTSGGVLMAVPPAKAETVSNSGIAIRIGEVTARQPGEKMIRIA